LVGNADDGLINTLQHPSLFFKENCK
jgi:hypothetical protein